jgi:DNA transformation protein
VGELSKLKGIGPKSEKCLNEIGIFTKNELVKTGAVKTFLKLQRESRIQPSLNFRYALVGAIENRRWTEIA